MGTNFSYFVTCPKGIEDLLHAELCTLGAIDAKIAPGGVQCSGDLTLAYSACLWLRTANRVLLVLEVSVPLVENSSQQLYEFVKSIDWQLHMSANATFVVDFSGTNKGINNTQFGAVRVKDAIADYFYERDGERPSIDRHHPQMRINARLHKDCLTLAIDLSGESLHKRSYRLQTGPAPLKENLAAAILMRAGWPDIAREGGSLMDPMCGSGTFLVEACWMALNRAPGLHRSFGFDHWKGHDQSKWHRLKQEALEHCKEQSDPGVFIYGSDWDRKLIHIAQKNIDSAECSQHVCLSVQDVKALAAPAGASPGLIVCNPPYGERLGDEESLRATYESLAVSVKQAFSGWRFGVFTGNSALAKGMRLRAKKRNKLMNGAIASELYIYELLGADEAVLRKEPESIEQLGEGATMVANRLKKNLKRLSPWLKKNSVTCYRVYDADMPEYSAAVDIYTLNERTAGMQVGEQLVHVQEYAPPKRIDLQGAERRLRELMQAVKLVLNVPEKNVFLKTRQKNRGADQYQAREVKSDLIHVIKEGRAQFYVNLLDYLDTGLFLDHRPLRQTLSKAVQGKAFLNLFCYTASATVHAALGGAKRTVSVDMSKTYLNWAQKNFNLNHLNPYNHLLVQADCIEWLKKCREGFDVIMLDPPSFSNSKRMTGVLDIQKDHASLINRCMDLLNKGGVLYFSNNLQSFKLDYEALDKYQIQDITPQTIDEDYKRNIKIHQCYEITH